MEWQEQILRGPSASHWKKISFKQRSGINLPLSALHSQHSCGIGEFFDLLPLIHWCAKLGFEVIQLLPINDTGLDPSPYNALSSCAIHPIYLSLHKLPYIEESSLISKIEDLRNLNAAPRVAFTQVLSSKMHFLLEYFELYADRILSEQGFKKFTSEHSFLKPYALFKALKEELGLPLSSWPDEIKTTPPSESLYERQIYFHLALQYLCFLQLQEVKKNANAQGILLKGDLPILISADSADVWDKPEFFNTTLSIGAPPDQYCPDGQNWGFPGIRWVDMKKQNCIWWKNRLQYAELFYDLYRIDHVIGLFRLWAIPLQKSPKDGKFIPEEENLWGIQGRYLLHFLLNNSSMLPIAEDLGVVPDIVRQVLQEMGIPGTKVMRWERAWHTDGSFLSGTTYPPLSLTCISTHDSPTLEQWWHLFPEEASILAAQKGWHYTPQLTHTQRQALLKDSLHSSSLFQINLLSEYLALVPDLVSPNPDDERINIPGTILPSNWTYKFRHPIETLVSNPLLEQEIRLLLTNSITN